MRARHLFPRPRSRALPTLLPLLAVFAPGPASAQAPDVDALDALYRRALSEWEVPGFSVAVVRNDSILVAEGYGVRRLGGIEPVDAETRFYTASLTKAFTGAALGVLADEGRLRGNDRVVQHLPEFRLADAGEEDLTILDLMAHRTSLPRADLLLFSGLSDAEAIERFRHLRRNPALNGQLAYSNQMYQVLGELIRTLSGAEYAGFIEDRILRPAGMDRSDARGSGHGGDANEASAHVLLNGTVFAVTDHPRTGYGGGAVNSTASDLARWARLVLAGGTIDGTEIFSAGVVQALTTPLTLAPPSSLLPGATLAAYGVGGFLHDFRGRLLVQQIGQGERGTAAVALLPRERIAVVVLTNLQGSLLPQALIAATLDHLLEEAGRDWLAEVRQTEGTIRSQVPRIPDQEILVDTPEIPTGAYDHPLYGTLTLTHGTGGVRLAYGSGLEGSVLPLTGDRFMVRWEEPALRAALGDVPIQFSPPEAAPRALLLRLSGEAIEFRSTQQAPEAR